MRFPMLAGLLVTVAVTPCTAQSSDTPGPDAPPEMEQYQFKIGRWSLTARSMLPDQTFNEGTGDLNVYFIHDGLTIQADMRISFSDGTGFWGSTFRTFRVSEGDWAVTWVPAGSVAGPGGFGVKEGERRVETFPGGSDQFGDYTDTLVFSEISDSYFEVRMDRQYAGGGPLIRGIWQYEATRIE